MGIIFRETSFPKQLHDAKTYYSVDFDFQDAHDPRRTRFYAKVRKLLGVKRIGDVTSTTSVIIIEDKDLAIKIAQLAREHGGIAHVREARSIEA